RPQSTRSFDEPRTPSRRAAPAIAWPRAVQRVRHRESADLRESAVVLAQQRENHLSQSATPGSRSAALIAHSTRDFDVLVVHTSMNSFDFASATAVFCFARSAFCWSVAPAAPAFLNSRSTR